MKTTMQLINKRVKTEKYITTQSNKKEEKGKSKIAIE